MRQILRGLTESQTATDPSSPDRRLVGRTYTIPFEAVWRASVGLCDGGLRGWSILSSDDTRGVIEAISRIPLLGLEEDVRVEIRLDENAQTRVDLWSASHRNRANFGRHRRVIGRFLRRLDRRLGARRNQILDPTAPTTWDEPI